MRAIIILLLLAGCTGSMVLNVTPMGLRSPAFGWGDMIPAKYTCDGADINPELLIDSIPKKTESFALAVEDPNTPQGWFVHWLIWNIPVAKEIPENSNYTTAVQGTNDFGTNDYRGPCPPKGETHQYRFRLYALDTKLDPSVNTENFFQAIDGHVIAEAKLVGRYKRT